LFIENEYTPSNINRFNVLDQADSSRLEIPSSPTNSNDSSGTLTPKATVRDLVYNVYESSRNSKK